MRLVCLPYAGGGAAAYRQWPALLPGDVEVVAVRLPARESRMVEEPVGRMDGVVPALVEALAGGFSDLHSVPYALYGHSMGATVAYEVARELHRLGLPPRWLFVSGRRAPHMPDDPPNLHDLPPDKFLAAVLDLNGVPAQILAEPGLIDLIVPALRADFAIVETYRHRAGEPLRCPISAFGGTDDPTTTVDQLTAWQTHTVAPFRLRMLDGDHFFIHASRETMLRAMLTDLDLT